MKIKSISIKNYKSISEIKIPFDTYGSQRSESSTTIFTGINESGKSNILEALKFVREGFVGQDFDEICNKTAINENEKYVLLRIDIDVTNPEPFKKHLLEILPHIRILVERMRFLNVEKRVYINNENTIFHAYSISFDEIPEIKGFIGTKDGSNQISIKERIILTGNEENSDINAEPVTNNDRTLKLRDFEAFCADKLKKQFDEYFPNVVYWRANENYLINDAIDLQEFMANPNISIPLKNIFRIFGKKTNTDIQATIRRALKSVQDKAEMIDNLSAFLTNHLNKIWKEHKINAKLNIDGNLISVHIEDKAKRYQYYNMNQRSDGFRQFLSLILSISAESATDILENSIVLLDEPEIHLHPSGIRFMRDELLKIGKKNYVFISTHSHYMIDREVMNRHWIVSKNPFTEIQQLTEYDSLLDEEVLAKGFGLNLVHELLPSNILLVEGQGDKSIFNHLLSIINNKLNYSIKHAGGCSKVYSTASILSNEEIKALVILDDDKEGRSTKSDIIKKLKGSFDETTVMTIRDIHGSFVEYGTIEDLLPVDIICTLFKSQFSKDLKLIDNAPILSLVVNQESSLQGRKNKINLDNFKIKIAEEFISNYRTLKSLRNSKSSAEEFTRNFVQLMN